AYLIEVFADSAQAGLMEDEGDSAASDFFRTRLAEPVPTGQVIVMKSPSTSGYEGVTVLGTPIVPEPGEDFDLTQFAGEGVAASEDGNALVAEVAGNPSISQGKYTVSPALHIRSNVDFSTGNIEFPGPVIVDGDVLDGFSVTAGADLTIKGVV